MHDSLVNWDWILNVSSLLVVDITHQRPLEHALEETLICTHGKGTHKSASACSPEVLGSVVNLITTFLLVM
jgi:hypothetical protein